VPSKGDKLELAQEIVHEMLHFNSFGSLEKGKKGEIKLRRVGLAIKSPKSKKPYFFISLNEALTTELSKRFEREYFEKIPFLKKEFRENKKALSKLDIPNDWKEEIAWIDLEAFRKMKKEELLKNEDLVVKFYSYWRERKALKRIIQLIFLRNRERFKSEEEVFEIFARAYFTGRLLELARLIEKTFGKGSFRKLAEV